MDILTKRTLFLVTRREIAVSRLTLVQSAYHNPRSCSWHYYEKPYFAFISTGLIESYKRQERSLSAGSLTYHHSQEPHSNSCYSPYVSVLHVNFEEAWFDRLDIHKARRITGTPLARVEAIFARSAP